MTEETVKKLYNHYSKLAEGKFQESDFNLQLGEGGSSQMGEMPPERKQLIISDGKKHKKMMEKKHPWLLGKESDPNLFDKLAENKTQKKAKK